MTVILENAAAQRLLEAFTQFRRLNWKQSPFEGVTSSEMMMLFSIWRMLKESPAGVKVSEISGILKVAPPTVTQQLNSLEANNLISRQIDSDDRRVIRVTITKDGVVILTKAHHEFLSALTGLVEHLGEEKSYMLADLLQQTHTYFQSLPASSLHTASQEQAGV